VLSLCRPAADELAHARRALIGPTEPGVAVAEPPAARIGPRPSVQEAFRRQMPRQRIRLVECSVPGTGWTRGASHVLVTRSRCLHPM